MRNSKQIHTNYSMPSTVLGASRGLTHLILTITLRGTHYYYLHFADKGTEGQSILLKLPQLVSGRHRIKAQAVGSWVQVLNHCVVLSLRSPNEDNTGYESHSPWA